MSKLKIGIIGTGGIAHAHIWYGYKHIEELCEIVAVCDIDFQKAKAFAKEFGIDESHAYGSKEDMIANETLDAVDICTWNVSHADCAIYSMKHGLHVFCEKPMAFNAVEAEEMKKVSEETGKILTIGFVTRFSDEAIVIKDYIDNGYLGDVYYAKAQYVRRLGNPGGWFGDKKRSGGGPVIDLGVHVIDRARYLMGRPMPVSVYAATFHKLGNRNHLKNQYPWKPAEAREDEVTDVEDFATALIRFDNGAVMQLEAAFSINDIAHEGIVNLCGTKAGIRAENGELVMYSDVNGYLTDTKIQTTHLKDSQDGFARELRIFANAVLGKCENIATADDGVICMKIVDAIYESAKTGHEIIIK